MKLLPAITLAAIALTCSLQCAIYASSQSNQIPTADKSPRLQLTEGWGPFKIDIYYDEVKLKDKLRINKSYFTVKVRNKYMLNWDVLVTNKMTRLEDLVRCENLTLVVRERIADLDCKSIDLHILDQDPLATGATGATGVDYVRRSTIKFKRSNFLSKDKEIKGILQLYPLKKEVVKSRMDSTLATLKAGTLNFTNLRVDLGYYYELLVPSLKEEVGSVISGDVLISINRTQILARLSDDTFPEFLAEMGHFIEQGIENGYLFSLENMRWHDRKDTNALLLANFSILQKPQFPYLTLSHTFLVGSSDTVAQYGATVNQTLHEKSPENLNSYFTTVDIKMRSGLFSMLNFNLYQTIHNEDLQTGWERMRLLHLYLGGLTVEGVWKNGTLMKMLDIYLLNDYSGDRVDLINFSKTIVFQFENTLKDIILNLKIDKKSLGSSYLAQMFQGRKSGLIEQEEDRNEGPREEL